MNGARLTIARKLRGKTQTDLARSIGISQKAISKYEKGELVPSKERLDSIAKELNVDVSFFFQPETDTPSTSAVSFRAQSKMSGKVRDKALATCSLSMSYSDWMDQHFELPSVDIPDLSGLDPEDAANAIRSEWLLGNGAIPNMIALLESHGVRVFSVCEADDVIDAFSLWSDERNRPFVFLTTAKSAERRRMDAAHELGHLVLHRKRELTGENSREIESEADRFASALLMPESGFRAMFNSNPSLDALKEAKRYWKTSLASVIYRAHQLDMISDWQYHNLFKNISMKGYRKSEPDGIQPERSQILDQIIKMYIDEHQTLRPLSNETNLPLDFLLSLSFRPAFTIVRQG